MLGITIALASTGTIDYPTAAALVLGENIGTTITALLACIGTNTQAIRAAVSHALFNLIGVGIILLLFHPYISFIDWLVPGNPEVLSSDGSKLYIAAHIAMGHTVFNVSATLIMLPFLALFAKLVERLVPERGRSTFKLKHINSSVPAISGVELSIARLELEHMVRLVGKALLRAERFIPKGKTDKRYFESVEKIEKITDNIQKEITSYVCQVIGQSLNNDQADEAYSLIRAADELESIADYCYSVCRYRSRLERYGQDFSSAGWEDVTTYYREIREFYRFVAEAVINEDLSKSDEIRKRGTELNKIADELRDRHIQRMGAGICQPLPALAFSDMIIALRRVKNHTINLFHASFYHADRSDSTDIGSLIISNLQRE
jgi:phosphate:Na+ symporter